MHIMGQDSQPGIETTGNVVLDCSEFEQPGNGKCWN